MCFVRGHTTGAARGTRLLALSWQPKQLPYNSGSSLNPGSKIIGLFSAGRYEKWKKNPCRLLPACRRWRGVIYVAADPAGGTSRYCGVRLRWLVDCCGRNLSLCSPIVPGHACMVVAFSQNGASFVVGTVLDALDRRIGQHTGAIR